MCILNPLLHPEILYCGSLKCVRYFLWLRKLKYNIIYCSLICQNFIFVYSHSSTHLGYELKVEVFHIISLMYRFRIKISFKILPKMYLLCLIKMLVGLNIALKKVLQKL